MRGVHSDDTEGGRFYSRGFKAGSSCVAVNAELETSARAIQGCRNNVERQKQLQLIVKQATRAKPFVPCCCVIVLGVDGQGHAADFSGNGKRPGASGE